MQKDLGSLWPCAQPIEQQVEPEPDPSSCAYYLPQIDVVESDNPNEFTACDYLPEIIITEPPPPPKMGDPNFDYRSLLSFRNEPEPDSGICGFLPEMTFRERMLGCATCMVAGYILGFGSFFRLKDLITGNPVPFVLNATIGNIIALAGSCFLTGPKAQYERMFHDSRRIATFMYLGSLFFTLLVAFTNVPGPKALYLLILMLCQYLAVLWYCLSYVPYAREFIQGYLQRRMSFSSQDMESLA